MSDFVPTMELRNILRRKIVRVGSMQAFLPDEYTSTLQQKWVKEISPDQAKIVEWRDVVSVFESKL